MNIGISCRIGFKTPYMVKFLIQDACKLVWKSLWSTKLSKIEIFQPEFMITMDPLQYKSLRYEN